MANTLYKNIAISVIGGDGNLAVQCVCLYTDKKWAVGDKITIIGEMRNHNGALEFERRCICEKAASDGETDATVIDALRNLQADETAACGPYAVTGMIQTIEKERSKLPLTLTYYIGALAMFFVGVFYLLMADLTFNNTADRLIVAVLLSFGSAILFFLSASFGEKPKIMFIFKGIGVALGIGFIVYIHIFQGSEFYLSVLDKFVKASNAKGLAATKATIIITLIFGYISIVAQGANTALVAVVKED